MNSILEYVDLNILRQYVNVYTFTVIFSMIVINYKWKRFNPNNKIKAFFYNLWLLVILPGTIVHELMHLFVGIFFKARPRGFSILPKKNDDGNYTLGSVGFIGMNSLNTFPVAMAPFLMLPLSIFLLLAYKDLLLLNPEFKMLGGYILYNLWSSSIPSIVDFKLLFKFPMTILFYAIIFYSFYKIL